MKRSTIGPQCYVAVMGVVAGVLLTGLLLPFVVGNPSGEDVTAAARSDSEPRAAGPRAAPSEPLPVDAMGPEEPVAGAVEEPGAGAGDAASPSGPVSTTVGAAPTTSAPTAQARTASDVGVTAEAVKMGFLLLDIGGLGQVGVDVGISVEQQQAAIQAFVDELNEHGGVNGRRVQPVYRPVNLLDQDAGRRACLQLTQDDKVFLAAGHLPRPEDVQCFTVQHGTSLLTTNLHSDEAYAKSQGRLTTLHMRGSRLMRNWVHELDALQYLGDRPVGIVTDEGFDQAASTAGVLKQALESTGHRVVRLSRLARDYHTGSGQIPVEVNQMRTAGVGVVFMMANSIYAQQFAQQADSQGWRPRYTTSPWATMDSDTSNENMPAGFDGSIGVASLYPDVGDWPEANRAVQCRAAYERRSGKKLGGRDTNEYSLTMLFCDAVHAVAAALQRAGANPTRASLAAGFEQIGRLEGQAWSPGGSFGPGKPDLLDHLRPQRWHADCKCYRPLGPYRRVRF